MSYLEPRRPNRPHACAKPAPNQPELTRWQCDDCGKIYCLEWIRDRGASELYWVEEK